MNIRINTTKNHFLQFLCLQHGQLVFMNMSKWCLKNINQRFQDCNIWARGGPSKREGIGSDTFLRNGSHKSEGTGTSPVAGIELEKGLSMKHIF